jgi:hypothetical protein
VPVYNFGVAGTRTYFVGDLGLAAPVPVWVHNNNTDKIPEGGNAKTPTDPNKLNHIFGKAEHNLDGVVQKMGGQQAAYDAIEAAAQSKVKSDQLTGVVEFDVQVGGQKVTVKGNVINGVIKIGTAFIP